MICHIKVYGPIYDILCENRKVPFIELKGIKYVHMSSFDICVGYTMES